MSLALLLLVCLVSPAATIDIVAVEPAFLKGDVHVALEGAAQAPVGRKAGAMLPLAVVASHGSELIGSHWNLLAGLVLIGVGSLRHFNGRRSRL